MEAVRPDEGVIRLEEEVVVAAVVVAVVLLAEAETETDKAEADEEATSVTFRKDAISGAPSSMSTSMLESSVC